MITISRTLFILIIFVLPILGMLYEHIMRNYRLFKNPDGIFYVNLTNPEEETFSMRIDLDLESIALNKFLIFKVQKK